MTQFKNKYDLEERTARFAEEIIDLCKKIRLDTINRRIIDQLIRSATSIGVNYIEANGAPSRKDFANKIHLCKKEAQETKHWLRLLLMTNPELKNTINLLWDECQQLTMIFAKIALSSKK